MNLSKNHLGICLFLTVLANVSFNSNVLGAEFPQYNIQATINAQEKTIKASETVIFTNHGKEAIGEIYFHLYANRKYTQAEKEFMLRYAGYFKINPYPDGFDSGKVTIHSVKRGQSSLPYQMEGEDETLLLVPLNEKLGIGETIEVAIDFSVDIPHAYGRFGWHENIFALSRWYPILSVLNDEGWNNHPFYPFHRPFFSDAATYSVQLTVPQNMKMIHTGDQKSETTSGENKVVDIETPLPVREFSLAMSPDYQVKESILGGVTIKSYYLPGDEYYGDLALKDAGDLMAYYKERFGEYPYKEFSIAPVYLGYGGEQMPNLIFIDTRVFKLPKFLNRYFDFLISHETGHQWFYNLVGIDEFTQMWLEEGVNSYFILEYLENKYGPNAEVAEIPESLSWLLPKFTFRGVRDIRYKMVARTNLDRPIAGKLSSFREPSSIFSLTYGKGSGVVSMLRYLIGNEPFNRVFSRVFKEYRFRNLDQKDFIKICEEESGKDLQWFFDQWLYSKKTYDVAVNGVRGRKIIVENRGGIVMPAEVKVRFKDGHESTIEWDGKNNIEELEVKEDGPIEQVVLDPGAQLLDIDRSNNTWPRAFKLKVVPLYIGLYDIPAFLPDDSYNFVIGPELGGGGLGVKASLQKPYDQNLYIATDFDFNDDLQRSRVGYQVNNLFHSQTVGGIEIFTVDDRDGGEEDLAGGKLYIRKELWPAAYGLTDINDHVTFYLLRDRSFKGDLTLSGLEDSRNVSYLRKDEAILGTALHLGRSGPYPDPREGYRVDTLLESSNHMLGATQFFYRSAFDVSLYQPVTRKSEAALRLKYGWGFPDDKNLYELGGMDGLRGYDRKTLRGSNMALGALEYRFPLIENLNLHLADNILGLESISGVVFFEAGRNWYDEFSDNSTKKDAGIGLRFSLNVGSFLEKVIVRLDLAQAIDEPDEDPHVWVGVNHAF